MNLFISSIPHHTNFTFIYHPINKPKPLSSYNLLSQDSSSSTTMVVEQQIPIKGKRLIFTYGTLKKGFSNHRLMEEIMADGNASYLGSYRTTEKYPLVCGPYRVPFLLNLPGQGDRVWGEVYLVSDKGLTRLDELEGITKGHYQRLPIQIADLPGGLTVDFTEAYFAHPSYANQMWKKNGEEGFVSYSSKEAKGYVKRQDRPQHLSFLDHISNFLSSTSH